MKLPLTFFQSIIISYHFLYPATCCKDVRVEGKEDIRTKLNSTIFTTYKMEPDSKYDYVTYTSEDGGHAISLVHVEYWIVQQVEVRLATSKNIPLTFAYN